MCQVFELMQETAKQREERRQLERSLRASGAAPPSSGSHPEDVAELVKLRVEESNAKKRAELAAKKADRASQSEVEIRARARASVCRLSAGTLAGVRSPGMYALRACRRGWARWRSS